MHSPERRQLLAHLRAESLPALPRSRSMRPPMTSAEFCRCSVDSPAGSVAGQTSTHLPQRVQASIMTSTRPCSADSKVAIMAIS
jgi:hypothetical protein